jgi:AcrR family transcriptional regulator
MSGRQDERSQATREALIRAARRLFAWRGFDGVAAEEIVAAARVTRGALYHHFEGKEGLFAAVVAEQMGEVHARLARASAAARSPLEAVELGVRSFLSACSEPAYQRVLLVDGPGVLGWHAWRALDLRYGLGLLRRGLEAAAAAGQLALPDVETATQVLAGALIDGAMLIGKSPSDRALRRRVEATLLRLLHGLTPAGTARIKPARRRRS